MLLIRDCIIHLLPIMVISVQVCFFNFFFLFSLFNKVGMIEIQIANDSCIHYLC